LGFQSRFELVLPSKVRGGPLALVASAVAYTSATKVASMIRSMACTSVAVSWLQMRGVRLAMAYIAVALRSSLAE
jgi:hypothetical protein